MKHRLFRIGFAVLGRSGLAAALAPAARGRGALLMFHHVRPAAPLAFDPNAILSITPDFLDTVLGAVRAAGYDIIAMDDVPARLCAPGRPFVALTFDDGYRDLVDHALPVLERHRAPFTAYVTTGFADQTADLWWLTLEDALRRLTHVRVAEAGIDMPTPDPPAKARAWGKLMRRVVTRADGEMRAIVGRLAAEAGTARDHAARLCLDWAEVRALAGHPLATIGAHTLTHPRLGLQPAATARDEIIASAARIAAAIDRPVRHFAYPVGDPVSAGRREFAVAAQAGFLTAVTTRPGVLVPAHAAHVHALPRLSVNGLHQSREAFRVLLSGLPTWLAAGGRRVNVG
jgi:peptidoglycan/xylan/chitin deacetylase (PgdA/CDA1 family)